MVFFLPMRAFQLVAGSFRKNVRRIFFLNVTGSFTGNWRHVKKGHGHFQKIMRQQNHSETISIKQKVAPKAREKNRLPKMSRDFFYHGQYLKCFVFVKGLFFTGQDKRFLSWAWHNLSMTFFAFKIVTGILLCYWHFLNHGHPKKSVKKHCLIED